MSKMIRMMSNFGLGYKARGFTLIELLVVITIVLILATVVLVIIQPVELQRKGRDSERIADLSSLNTAIGAALKEEGATPESILCAGGSFPCSGASYPLESSTRALNGTGWLKVDLENTKSITDPMLPIDPVNDSMYHYTYCADNGAWELNTTLESEQLKPRMATDTGDQNATDHTGKYEIGTNLTLINSSGAPCSY